MGWLKVAEALINPFGEDDDDYEMNWLIDRNLQVAYLIVDEMHAEHPELVKDQFWDEGVPDELPYTVAAEEKRQEEPWIESTAEVTVSPKESEFVYHERLEDDEEFERFGHVDDLIGGSHTAKISNKEVSSKMNSIESRRNESHGSLIHRIFPSTRSSSRLDLQRIESGVSVISNAIKKTRKKSKNAFDRSTRKSSHPYLRRIPTDAREFQQLSESFSTESFEGQQRQNIEANILKEVQELMKKDIENYKGSVNINENPNYNEKVELDEDKHILKTSEKKIDSVRPKLEHIQEVQTRMMKELGNENNEFGSSILKVDKLEAVAEDDTEHEKLEDSSMQQSLEAVNDLPTIPSLSDNTSTQGSQISITENPMLIDFDKTPENPTNCKNFEDETVCNEMPTKK